MLDVVNGSSRVGRNDDAPEAPHLALSPASERDCSDNCFPFSAFRRGFLGMCLVEIPKPRSAKEVPWKRASLVRNPEVCVAVPNTIGPEHNRKTNSSGPVNDGIPFAAGLVSTRPVHRIPDNRNTDGGLFGIALVGRSNQTISLANPIHDWFLLAGIFFDRGRLISLSLIGIETKQKEQRQEPHSLTVSCRIYSTRVSF